MTPKLCFRRETVLLCRNQCILVPILGHNHPFSILESHFFGDDPVRKNFDDVENAMDQAVKAGSRVTRTWGFRDLNVTYIPSEVSEKSPSFGVFVESELSAITAS